METLIQKIARSLDNFEKTLILNGDDPNVYRLAEQSPKAKIVTFGVDRSPNVDIGDVKEGHYCPRCEGVLDYDWFQYSHIGFYHCDTCDFARPNLTYEAKEVKPLEGSFSVDQTTFRVNVPALYHIYNCMAAYAVCRELHVDEIAIAKVFSTFHLEAGRMEMVGEILLNLVKNPTGANEVFRYIRQIDGKKALLFLLNDNVADGRDISWIWDMALEQLQDLDTVICTGLRAYDMALRFRYGNYSGNLIVKEDLKEAVEILRRADGKRFAIANYTGLFALRKELQDGL